MALNDGGPETATVHETVKTADRPHRWTVALSLLAAAISIASAAFSWLSLNETRENRRINEQTARAYLRLTSLVLDGSLFSATNWADSAMTGFVTLTNTGRVAATEISTRLDLNPPHGDILHEIASIHELAPGSSTTVRIILKLDGSRGSTHLTGSNEYIVRSSTTYTDGVNRAAQVDESTFCMPTAKAGTKSMISLYPCDVQFADQTPSPK